MGALFRLSFRTKLLASHVGLVVAVIVVAFLALNQTLVADLHRQLDLGASLTEVDAAVLAMQRRLLFAWALAIVLALGLGFFASRLAARPFLVLTARVGDLVAERDRLSAIVFGMAEGVVVTDADQMIVLANPAASSIRPLASGTSGAGSVTVLRDMTRVRHLLTLRRDFVANVSHELRTPVAAIQGYAETLLEQKGDPATQQQFLEITHRQSQRIGALVADLLTLSELQARPKEEVLRETVDMASLASNVIETLRAGVQMRGARVEVHVTEGLRALGDPIGLEQVIQNLIDNALKYGKRGGKVRVRGVRDAGRVVLTVTDDGPGIAREHLPRLFERFYRVDSGRSREQGGTGLGLAIVKHLVESMGGSVDVESEIGRGTTFRVDLPAA